MRCRVVSRREIGLILTYFVLSWQLPINAFGAQNSIKLQYSDILISDSATDSSTHSLTHSRTHSLTHSLMHSVAVAV